MENIPFGTLISSDLERARLTVEIGFGGRGVPHVTTPLLREIDWGSWTGKTISGVKLAQRPADAETNAMLYARAGKFLAYLKSCFDGQTILAVGHGMINRYVAARLENLPEEKVKEIPVFNNCEYRVFHLL